MDRDIDPLVTDFRAIIDTWVEAQCTLAMAVEVAMELSCSPAMDNVQWQHRDMDSANILLATTNPAKQRRLRWLFEGLAIQPVTPTELGLDHWEPEEEGSSHRENARLKAQRWSEAAAMPAISSDGGLVIPSLGQRWESLLTHRFAGEEADEDVRLDRLLHLMKPYKGKERRASWVEALAIASGGTTLASWEVNGPTGLLLQEAGAGPAVPGFWVFSVWYFPHLGKHYNQLDEAELKRLNDHWSQLEPLVQRFLREEMWTTK